ncbi:hypothetical protein [Chryseobacterium rhizosphaerae]|uniref:hypothetical protein n=1 Tax=Chryseobacterium rhizosphaerae TaxID=395937 RepID=UPI003D1078B5
MQFALAFNDIHTMIFKPLNLSGVYLSKIPTKKIIILLKLEELLRCKYKDFPIFYFTDATTKESDYGKKNLNRLLQPSNYSIDNFEVKNQSVVYGEYAYFKNGKFIKNKDQISAFFEKYKDSSKP